jgi:hypothetical protein
MIMKVFGKMGVSVLMVLLFTIGICFAQSTKGEAETVSDSFTFTGTPYWLGSGVGIGSAAVVTREGVRNIIVLEDKPAYKYLKEHNGQISIKEVYPSSNNPYGMPTMVIYANVPLNAIEKSIGKNLLNELLMKGKIKGGRVVETIEFVSVKFVKKGNDFVASNWLPKFLLYKFMNTDTKPFDNSEIIDKTKAQDVTPN